MSTYNGWKNRETWNVALWIQNDEGLYNIAKECKRGYAEFMDTMRELNCLETPDKVAWNDSSVDGDAICKMMEEL